MWSILINVPCGLQRHGVLHMSTLFHSVQEVKLSVVLFMDSVSMIFHLLDLFLSEVYILKSLTMMGNFLLHMF